MPNQKILKKAYFWDISKLTKNLAFKKLTKKGYKILQLTKGVVKKTYKNIYKKNLQNSANNYITKRALKKLTKGGS